MAIDPMSAILTTYRDAIRTHLGLSGQTAERTVAITDDGKPHPACGQQFYGLVGGQFSNNSGQGYVDGYLGISIYLTLRAPVIPTDKAGDELIIKAQTANAPNTGGIWPRAWWLHEYLKTNRITLMNSANVLLDGDTNTRGFCEPFLLQSFAFLGVKGPDWFWAEGQDDAPSGMALQINLDRCRYVDQE